MPAALTGGTEAPPKRGKTAFRFFISLLLAILFWLFNSLSATFTEELPVQVNYHFSPDKIAVEQLPQVVQVLVQTNGWHLLREKFKKRELEIDLADFHAQNIIITNDQKELFRSSMSHGFEILKITPDSIPLHIEDKVSRLIPVVPNLSISFQSGYFISDTIEITPDSILITGAASDVNSTMFWFTEVISAEQLDHNLSGTVALMEKGDLNISLSAVVVSYLVPVGKFDTIPVDSSFNLLQKQ